MAITAFILACVRSDRDHCCLDAAEIVYNGIGARFRHAANGTAGGPREGKCACQESAVGLDEWPTTRVEHREDVRMSRGRWEAFVAQEQTLGPNR